MRNNGSIIFKQNVNMKSPATANAKTVIKQYNAAAISEVLKREIPNLAISAITIIETGWDHLVAEVNEDWIFRFPRTEGSIANLEREKQLLEYLKNKITLPIPHYYYSGTDIAFVGYRKIPGIHLNRLVYASLTPDVRHHIAETLAKFFTQLHHAVSKRQALQWEYTHIIRPLEEMESNLLGTLPPDISVMVQKAITHAREDLSAEQNLVFCHQDVNGDNTAFNVTTGQITGVFDFSDVGIGPYSWDVAELFNIDAELASLTAEIYSKLNNVPNPLVGGATDYILRKATLMLEARKKGNTQDEIKLLKGLTDFTPVWHYVLAKTDVESILPLKSGL
jgi:aminoglycoside 2''-phosphotransferase